MRLSWLSTNRASSLNQSIIGRIGFFIPFLL